MEKRKLTANEGKRELARVRSALAIGESLEDVSIPRAIVTDMRTKEEVNS